MEDDWDLYAVVRSCAAAISTATTAGITVSTGDSYRNPIFSPVTIERRNGSYMYPNNAIFGELRDLYSPLLQEPSDSVTSFSCLSFAEEQRHQQQQRQRQTQTQKRSLSVSVSSSSVNSRPASSNTSRSKRRKIQQKKVCHVPAEALNSDDVWAWRKYGQKPIKGSPYPRGYYRCSTSKSCLARKQVERNRSDPRMFIVTFTAEHNHPAPTHRNSLAGSTRQKPSDQQPAISVDNDSTKSSPTNTTTSTSAAAAACSCSSPVTYSDEFAVPVEHPAIGDLDGDEDLQSLSDTVASEDFFDGLEDFTIGDSFSGSSPASFDLFWIADNAAAPVGGI